MAEASHRQNLIIYIIKSGLAPPSLKEQTINQSMFTFLPIMPVTRSPYRERTIWFHYQGKKLLRTLTSAYVLCRTIICLLAKHTKLYYFPHHTGRLPLTEV